MTVLLELESIWGTIWTSTYFYISYALQRSWILVVLFNWPFGWDPCKISLSFIGLTIHWKVITERSMPALSRLQPEDYQTKPCPATKFIQTFKWKNQRLYFFCHGTLKEREPYEGQQNQLWCTWAFIKYSSKNWSTQQQPCTPSKLNLLGKDQIFS